MDPKPSPKPTTPPVKTEKIVVDPIQLAVALKLLPPHFLLK